MSLVFRTLLILSLVWCALGIGEPAAAYDDMPARYAAAGADHAGKAPADTPATPEPGGHHHCPVSPELPCLVAAAPTPPSVAPPVPARAATLVSLTRAPPLQPPAA